MSKEDTVKALFARIELSGLSETEVSRRAGINFSSLNRWKRGKTRPSSKTLQKVNDALDQEFRRIARRAVLDEKVASVATGE